MQRTSRETKRRALNILKNINPDASGDEESETEADGDLSDDILLVFSLILLYTKERKLI